MVTAGPSDSGEIEPTSSSLVSVVEPSQLSRYRYNTHTFFFLASARIDNEFGSRSPAFFFVQSLHQRDEKHRALTKISFRMIARFLRNSVLFFFSHDRIGEELPTIQNCAHNFSGKYYNVILSILQASKCSTSHELPNNVAIGVTAAEWAKPLRRRGLCNGAHRHG